MICIDRHAVPRVKGGRGPPDQDDLRKPRLEDPLGGKEFFPVGKGGEAFLPGLLMETPSGRFGEARSTGDHSVMAGRDKTLSRAWATSPKGGPRSARISVANPKRPLQQDFFEIGGVGRVGGLETDTLHPRQGRSIGARCPAAISERRSGDSIRHANGRPGAPILGKLPVHGGNICLGVRMSRLSSVDVGVTNSPPPGDVVSVRSGLAILRSYRTRLTCS